MTVHRTKTSTIPAIVPLPFESIPCPKCQSIEMRLGESLELNSVKKSDDSEWILAGHMKLFRCMHGQCCNCGFIIEAIRQEIPVTYPELIKCPKCVLTTHLKYEVNQVELGANPAKFVVRVSCLNCGKQSRFSRLMKKLWSIVEIELSFLGAKVKVSGRGG